MLPRTLLFLLVATHAGLATGGAAPSSAKPGQPSLQWKQTEVSLALVNGQRIIWQLNYDPGEGKPYFHPMTATDGTVLTALRPADHPWHRGLWWSWKYINGVNYWDEDKQGQPAGKTVLKEVSVNARPDYGATINMSLVYQPPGAEPVLTEERAIDVSRPDLAGGVTITWRATFTAGSIAAVLDRTPIPGQPKGSVSGGYAGLSLRLSEAAKDWEFDDSENGRGEQAIHGRTARWVGYGAPGGPGVRMWDDDKSNPRFPITWYASRTLKYLGTAFLFQGPFTLEPGKKLEFANRVVIQPRRRPTPPPEAIVITLESVPGKMKYDIESFQVTPGARVTLRLKNNDDMLHNVVICRAPLDFGATLGGAAMQLGEKALGKNFVPDLPEVLFHTPLVEPGGEQTIQFVAPAELGAYPYFCTFPGHWATMKGVMRVASSNGPLGEPTRPGPVANVPVRELRVQEAARVDRLPMPDCSPVALAVGLPGGLNYCFDVKTLAVRYAWRGRYLDVGPNYAGRGGETVNLLGERLNVGYVGPALSLGTNETPALEFKGYQAGPVPRIFYVVDGVAIAQSIQAASSGIVYDFEVEPTLAPIHFRINPAGLKVTSTAGQWENGRLTVTPATGGVVTRFVVVITNEK